MNNIRTVRLLDRAPGQRADDARTVAGYVIERGVPVPSSRSNRSELRAAIAALGVGESLVADTVPHDILTRQRLEHPDRGYTQRKLKTGGWRVWRTA